MTRPIVGASRTDLRRAGHMTGTIALELAVATVKAKYRTAATCVKLLAEHHHNEIALLTCTVNWMM